MRYATKLFCVCLLAAMGCRSGASNEGLLAPDSMKVVMWDMMKADELYLRISAKDTTAARRKENIRLYEQVFAVHRITKKQFDRSYHFYAAHPDQFKLLLDSLDTYALRERTKQFEKKYGAPK